MDTPETTIVGTSHVAGAMNYPSTTQALFALIVMIIVLVFILVYCCWGTFTCVRPDGTSPGPTDERNRSTAQQNVQHILNRQHAVIVPVNNMIYVGDPETQQIYQIPMNRDKPPSYTDIFRSGPPPPYRSDTVTSGIELNTNSTMRREQQDNRRSYPENPPPYHECGTAAPQEPVPSSSEEDSHSSQEGATACTTDTSLSNVTNPSQSPAPEPPQQQVAHESPPQQITGLVLSASALSRMSPRPPEEETSSANCTDTQQHSQDEQTQ